ncbi:alpha/beta-hydrolase [Neoconidiobolus thromboides FSU 785]|nr:alpha/beta-hydrolase [Neoconidiobolus thromboides FSU 785]
MKLKYRRIKPAIYHLNKIRSNSTLSTIDKAYFTLSPFYKASRNPIVLCHGLYGYDKIAFENFPYLQINYWQGIAESLKQLGNEVIIAKVPRTGSIEERTNQLNLFLERVVSDREVNIIGHSMGGLDGRYLISKVKNKKYKVLSLSTISTPHYGSQFMDWCQENLNLGRKKKENENPIYTDINTNRPLLNKLLVNLDAPAYYHLTTDYCKNIFNPNTPNCNDVKYFSYNAYIEKMNKFALLYLPWSIIKERAGKNDGIVALNSSVWGEHVETVEASHFDLVSRYRWIYAFLSLLGFQDPRYHHNPKLPLPKSLFLNPSPNLDTIEFYLRISNFLYSKGF